MIRFLNTAAVLTFQSYFHHLEFFSILDVTLGTLTYYWDSLLLDEDKCT